jgi:hypothetical protein
VPTDVPVVDLPRGRPLVPVVQKYHAPTGRHRMWRSVRVPSAAPQPDVEMMSCNGIIPGPHGRKLSKQPDRVVACFKDLILSVSDLRAMQGAFFLCPRKS